MSRSERVWLAAACVAAAAVLFAISGFSPWISPDTGGYLDPPPLPDAWGRQRHPLFGWLLALLPGGGFGLLPSIQVALFLAATALLHATLRRYGVSARGAASCTAALLGSNLLLLWHNAVHPEMLSAVLALCALAFTVRAASGGGLALNGGLAAAALGTAMILRPTFLPAILLVPLLYAALARLHETADGDRRTDALPSPSRGGVGGGGGAVESPECQPASPPPRPDASRPLGPPRKGEGRFRRIPLRAALLALACATPFLLNSAIRWRAVGDFNVVSFGGFQMSGMAALILSPEIVAALPDDVRPLGAAILAGREAAERDGRVLRTPENSGGERSFVSAALGYYDLYARTYDALLYGPVASLQDGDSWVAWNARLMRFSLAVVRAAPGRYAAWVVGGTARFVGRALVVNLAFVLALAGFALLAAAALARGRLPGVQAAGPLDVPALLCLTAAYTAMAGALTVLTTFPAARYIDTAALFLPALPAYACLSLAAALRRRH